MYDYSERIFKYITSRLDVFCNVIYECCSNSYIITIRYNNIARFTSKKVLNFKIGDAELTRNFEITMRALITDIVDGWTEIIYL